MKFLTFGEIMLRLKAPGQECFFQSPMLEATFGGGEANGGLFHVYSFRAYALWIDRRENKRRGVTPRRCCVFCFTQPRY